MNEIQTNNFDYSVLDSSTAEYLQDRENSMSKTLENAAEKLGEDLTKAKEKLSKKGYGCFEDWYTSLGLKTTSVYRYINRYEFVSSKLEDSKMLETFQDLTPSLQNEMSKPSANPEINQKVFDGDIKTHKEYKELEKKLRNAESNVENHKNWFHDVATKLEKRQEENEILQSKLEDAENREPEIIERYTEPEDYEELKENIRRMKRQEQSLSENNKRLMEEISDMRNERSDMDVKSKKYEELTQAINEMDNRLTEGQVRIKNQKLVYDLVQRSEALIKEVAPLVYAIDHLDVEDNEYATKPLLKIAKSLDDITKKIYKQLNENQIIEVE